MGAIRLLYFSVYATRLKNVAIAAVAAGTLFGSMPIMAKAPPQDTTGPLPLLIPGAVVKDFQSKINHVDYRVTVALPTGYDPKKAGLYPVFYLLDGRWLAPDAIRALHSLTGLLVPDIPDIIVVGIDYPGKTGRSLDYGTSGEFGWKIPAERGIKNFMRVLKEEVVPYVDSTFATDKSNRAIGGHSFSGFAATYALFHANDTFNRFWISSPSLVWNYGEALGYPKTYAAKSRVLNAMVYADAGELESRADMVDLVEQLRERTMVQGFTGLTWKQHIFEDSTHATVPPAAISKAMLFFYGLPEIEVPTSRLDALVGMYRKPDGTILRLSTDGKSLYADGISPKNPLFSQSEHLRLKAATPDHFFETFLALHLHFPAGEISPKTVEIEFPDDPGAYKKNKMKTVVAERVEDNAVARVAQQ